MTTRKGERPVLYQVLAAAAPFDAVTGQALALRAALDRAGIASAIAAEHVDPAVASEVAPLRLVDRRVPILLRYSIWSAAAETALAGTGRLGVVFHNITPAAFLVRANPAVAALCELGRAKLPTVAARADVLIADSGFNADELWATGGTDVQVVPLLMDLAGGGHMPATGSDHVLYVGRLAPNKRVEDCIDTAVLLRRRRPGTRLHIVGSGDAFRTYERALREHTRVNRATEYVEFHGRVDDHTRNRLYAQAGAYLSLSEHEGFCVPVVEAMDRGLPVVARDAGAVRETAGGGALLVEGRNPELAAAALEVAISDSRVRAGLAANARARLAELDRSVVEPQIVGVVRGLLA